MNYRTNKVMSITEPKVIMLLRKGIWIWWSPNKVSLSLSVSRSFNLVALINSIWYLRNVNITLFTWSFELLEVTYLLPPAFVSAVMFADSNAAQVPIIQTKELLRETPKDWLLLRHKPFQLQSRNTERKLSSKQLLSKYL